MERSPLFVTCQWRYRAFRFPPGFPHGTKPFVSAPTIDLIRPLSLTEQLRLCQNIEHYDYRYECRVPQASIHRHDARVPSTKIE
jgi:hypothetical protein